MSFRLALELLDYAPFVERVKVRLIDLLVLGGVDPERTEGFDEARNELKAAVIAGRIDIKSMIMVMFAVSPTAAIAAVSDMANPGDGLDDQGLDDMIQAAWEQIKMMGP